MGDDGNEPEAGASRRMEERYLPDTWVLEWKKVMTDKVPGTVFKTKIYIQFNKEE